ncbi:GDP-mannose 6-dehydrogenase [Desulfuromonas versatilis]|uniref:UDP-glucose 6-dehydrogenase n=1 Tax=Desulfuromonas versatilis TaxID=2802975 RepID=A0ABM8HXG6_9BACT|nr:UDP-glucose/GDP-mannose dehydrogenase family protein [Desulfuromonas versatilis]BCR05276.1 GDP-mannose 6-dehydrogenase [Desulfuromonas versatilis]
MNISVFGLGYVGAVSAGCLARDGHVVIGVDPNLTKVDLINRGLSPIIENEIGEIISDGLKSGRLSATNDSVAAVLKTEISLICVGTPSQLNGSLDLKYVRRVCEEIGAAIAKKTAFHVVVARSTILPGTMRDVVIPTLEESSGKKAGIDFGVCNNPEFLREGTAVNDYFNPPKTVIGETDEKSGEMLAQIYASLDAPLVRTDVATAEMVKYTDNVWHALKVGFANEIGNICKALEIDGHQVMDIFCQDKKLNLSPYYLKPGFAFGGSCLPKDVRALTYKAKILDIETPVLNAILPGNQLQVQRGLKMIMGHGKRKIGVLGFSFKEGTDDLRESPIVDVIESLIGKGYELKLYDKNVNMATITGANRDYILNHIPHISRLMVRSVQDVLENSEVIVIGNGSKEFSDVLRHINSGQIVIDFVRIGSNRTQKGRYEGICW